MDDLTQFREAVAALPGMIGEPTFETLEDCGKLRARVIDNWNEYVLDAIPRSADERRGYLGAVYTKREPYPGEDWRRGNDLSDGPFALTVWARILMDIIQEKMRASQAAMAELTEKPTEH